MCHKNASYKYKFNLNVFGCTVSAVQLSMTLHQAYLDLLFSA